MDRAPASGVPCTPYCECSQLRISPHSVRRVGDRDRGDAGPSLHGVDGSMIRVWSGRVRSTTPDLFSMASAREPSPLRTPPEAHDDGSSCGFLAKTRSA